MQKPDKAPEPSMEEILASIRKIIAEEPIGTRPGPEPRGPALSSTSSQPAAIKPSDLSDNSRFSLPSRDERGSDRPPFSVDDALADLIDDPPLPRFATAPGREDPAPKPPTRAAATPEEDNQRPSWLFARPAGSPAQPAPESSSDGIRGTGLLGQLDSIRPLPHSGTAGGESLAPKPPGPQKISVPEPLFDRQREADRPSIGGITPLPSGGPHDLPRPGVRTSPPDTGHSGQRGDGPQSSAPAGPGGNRLEPSLQQPTLRTAEPVRDAGSATAVEAKPQPVESAATPAERPRQSQPRAEAPVAERPAPAPVADRSPRIEASPLATLAQGLAAVAPAGSSEAIRVEPDAAPKPDAPAGGAAVRTLEDTVAELLRPMLRDWLDANMPRIVEKALRVELAASAKRSGSAD